jgi:glycosyltransferase involved in cell wall biosynthesis
VPVGQTEALATIRQLILAVSIVWSHLSRDRWRTAWLFWRALPQAIRGPLLSLAVIRGSALGALGLAADGQQLQARHTLLELAERDSARILLSVVSAATVINELAPAWLALARARTKQVDCGRVEALLLWTEGHLRRAQNVAAGTNARRNRRLVNRMEGDLAALLPQQRVPTAPNPRCSTRRTLGGSVTSVLHVVTSALPEVQAGYTLRTHGIAQAQAAKRQRVSVVTRLGFPVDIGVLGAAECLILDQVRYQRLLPARGIRSSAGARLDQGVKALEQLTRNLRPHLLHAHSKHDNAQLSLAVGRRMDLPVLYEVRGFLEETWRSRGGDSSTDLYRISKEAETWCMQQSNLVVTLSETMRAEILRRGIHSSRVMVIPNAVPTAFLAPPPDGRMIRRRLGIVETAFVVGAVSTLNEYEGIQTLIDAVRVIKDKAVHLLVVGDGPAANDLRRSSLDIADQVTFTGKVPHTDIRLYYAAIDMFCVPRRRTPVTELVPPLKPLGALACGVPLLVSDLPPLNELLSQSGGGWAARLDLPEIWAAEISQLRDQAEERRAKGCQGKAWVREFRTWSALTDTYDVAYARLGVGTT